VLELEGGGGVWPLGPFGAPILHGVGANLAPKDVSVVLDDDACSETVCREAAQTGHSVRPS